MAQTFDSKKFIAGLHDYLARALNPLHQRLQALEEQMQGVQKAGIRYRGVYQRADSYKRGDVVTHDSSAWICVADKSDAAPAANPDWQLMVKGQNR